jgi:lipoprotein-anchoring transpeptidase ErfK/SrfK
MRKLLVTVMALALLGATHQACAEPAASATAEQAAAKAATAPAVDAAAVIPVAPPKPVPPAITLTAAINLTTQKMTVSYGGKVQHSWAISSGARGFETPVGAFKPQWTAKLWHSRKYDMAPMPHAVFFSGGAAIHATSSVGRLGSPASHGCVRLAPANAAQFYALVAKHGNVHTRITVNGRPNFNDDVASSRRSRQQLAQADTRPQSRGYAPYDGHAYYAPQPQPARTYRAASYYTPTSFGAGKHYRY